MDKNENTPKWGENRSNFVIVDYQCIARFPDNTAPIPHQQNRPTLAYRREDGVLERIVPISTFDSQWIRAEIPPKWGENRSNFVIVDYQCIAWFPDNSAPIPHQQNRPTLTYRREDGVAERIVPISSSLIINALRGYRRHSSDSASAESSPPWRIGERTGCRSESFQFRHLIVNG